MHLQNRLHEVRALDSGGDIKPCLKLHTPVGTLHRMGAPRKTNNPGSHLCGACSAGGLRLLRHKGHCPANVQCPACIIQVPFSFCDTKCAAQETSAVKVSLADSKALYISTSYGSREVAGLKLQF